MKIIAENKYTVTPLPSRGGVGGGVCIFLPVKKFLTPPLPLPYKGGEKLKWLLVLLVAVCCLKAEAQGGIRRVAPYGEVLLHRSGNILAGDVNGDGRVDMVDVTQTIKFLTDTPPDGFIERAADVNIDSVTDAADVPLIVKIILNGGCPDSHHPHTIDLGLPSGTKWACCNVGANTPAAAGRYFTWGSCYQNSPFLYNWDMYPYGDSDEKVTYIGSDIAGTNYDAALYSWGVPWRMPSLAQCNELVEFTTSVWVEQDGVSGRLFTGRNGRAIFMPAAGDIWYRDNEFDGVCGLYWTSTLVDEYQCAAYYLGFSSGSAYTDYYYRYGGRTIRPVCTDF